MHKTGRNTYNGMTESQHSIYREGLGPFRTEFFIRDFNVLGGSAKIEEALSLPPIFQSLAFNTSRRGMSSIR
jgi:hypothetical protein